MNYKKYAIGTVQTIARNCIIYYKKETTGKKGSSNFTRRYQYNKVKYICLIGINNQCILYTLKA